jgi:hypothetical protein
MNKTIKETNKCFIIVLAIIIAHQSSCTSDNRNTQSSSRIFKEELCPKMLHMSKTGSLPGIHLGATDVINAVSIPKLCRIADDNSTNRMFILANKENSGTSHTYIFTRKNSSMPWDLTSAWTTTPNGYRGILTSFRTPKSVVPEKATKDGSPSAGRISDTIEVVADPADIKNVSDKLFTMSDQNLLPLSPSDQWVTVAVLPRSDSDGKMVRPSFLEVYVASKDQSAEYFYLFTPGQRKADWILSSVLKLASDGSVVIQPGK